MATRIDPNQDSAGDISGRVPSSLRAVFVCSVALLLAVDDALVAADFRLEPDRAEQEVDPSAALKRCLRSKPASAAVSGPSIDNWSAVSSPPAYEHLGDPRHSNARAKVLICIRARKQETVGGGLEDAIEQRNYNLRYWTG
jgi:hypothetical protein